MTQNIECSFPNIRMYDMNALLEFIHTNDDVNVQVKLFSTLSTYIMSKKVNIAEIVTYNSLYDKICNVLSNCPPRKASVLLNFLSALLYAVDEDGKAISLAVHARNMIRSSGCLATMCEFFTNCMMNQDAWRSLCRCLAESCRNVEANQSYCTHLVPMCVQRCSQRNIEVLLVLQSLLQNHAKNINLFIESNGISLFRRELLQHDICLELLSTLVQSSEKANELVNKSDVHDCLYDFLRLYGPESQLGQWATIILYHMSGTKGTYVIPFSKQHMNEMQSKSVADKLELQNTADTTGFFQNVMKEIMQCGILPEQPQSKNRNNLLTPSTVNHNQQLTNKIWSQNTFTKFNNCNLQKCVLESKALLECKQNKGAGDLSFSFLYNDNNRRYRNASIIVSKNTSTFQKGDRTSANVKISDFSESPATNYFNRHDTPELSSFTPKFISTPKKHYNREPNKSRMQYVRNGTAISFCNSIGKVNQKRGKQCRKDIFKVAKARCPKRLESNTNASHRSISGWFLDAVNESCTTLVKTVTNIFRPKNKPEETKIKSSTPVSVNSTRSCSYSFTNYMRKRDAILKNECSKESNVDVKDFSMEMSNSCTSCNDTVELKKKLANDEYLKQTVRKLKLGINLYGCDFKKISKQLWPQQTYMTPVVLYNLYRKLIIK